jgi:hypothetical protein
VSSWLDAKWQDVLSISVTKNLQDPIIENSSPKSTKLSAANLGHFVQSVHLAHRHCKAIDAKLILVLQK